MAGFLGQAGPRNAAMAFTQEGRMGDTIGAHVAPDEMMLPKEIWQQPGIPELLQQAFAQQGKNPEEYIAGNFKNKINPATGAPEFFGIGMGVGGGVDPNAPDASFGQDPGDWSAPQISPNTAVTVVQLDTNNQPIGEPQTSIQGGGGTVGKGGIPNIPVEAMNQPNSVQPGRVEPDIFYESAQAGATPGTVVAQKPSSITDGAPPIGDETAGVVALDNKNNEEAIRIAAEIAAGNQVPQIPNQDQDIPGYIDESGNYVPPLWQRTEDKAKDLFGKSKIGSLIMGLPKLFAWLDSKGFPNQGAQENSLGIDSVSGFEENPGGESGTGSDSDNKAPDTVEDILEDIRNRRRMRGNRQVINPAGIDSAYWSRQSGPEIQFFENIPEEGIA